MKAIITRNGQSRLWMWGTGSEGGPPNELNMEKAAFCFPASPGLGSLTFPPGCGVCVLGQPYMGFASRVSGVWTYPSPLAIADWSCYLNSQPSLQP